MLNAELFAEAKRYIPGGVNSPVRSFNAVGGVPFFTQKAKDCFLYDAEGNKLIDYICSWGANIVGHANEEVVDKVAAALKCGLSFGTPTELELEFAKKINRLMPSIEKFRLVSSGTEAVMSAMRVARGYTQKKYIIKFEGCYHGHSDSLLVQAGSGLLTHSVSGSAGVLEEMVRYTLVAKYNNVDSVAELFKLHPDDIAAIIIEPFTGNMNLVKPSQEFMQAINDLCKQHNSLLIFDEVMTGFRVALGGAQSLLGITPDMTILAKVIGGGMPLAGFGGRADIMNMLSPLGPVYQAGTLSGNPIAVTCGLATLDIVERNGFYKNISATTTNLVKQLTESAKKHGVPFCGDSVGGMFGLYFSNDIPKSLDDVKAYNQALFKRFFHAMLSLGVYLAPSLYEAGFICSKHNAATTKATVAAADKIFSVWADSL